MESLETVIQRDVFNIVRELKKCNNFSKYNDLVSKYYYISELINELELSIKYPKELEFELNKKSLDKIDKVLTRKYDETVKINEKINKKIIAMNNYFEDRYLNSEFDKEYNNIVDINDSINIVKDFFKQYDDDIYNFFISYLKNPRLVFIEGDNSEFVGYCTNSDYLTDSYVVVNVNNNLCDLITLAHEIIHAYNYTKIKYITENENAQIQVNSLREVYSYFIELVLMNYLEKNKINTDDVKLLKSCSDKELLSFMLDLEDSINACYFNYTQFLNAEVYTYGKILAYHYYDLYLKDKNNAKSFLYRFMLDNKDHDRFYMLSNYGLNINDITNPQKLSKHIDKHLKRVN